MLPIWIATISAGKRDTAPNAAKNQLLGVRAMYEFISDFRKMTNETISTTDIVSMIRLIVEIWGERGDNVPDAKTPTHPRIETAGTTTQQRSMNRPPLVRGKRGACTEVVEFIGLTIDANTGVLFRAFLFTSLSRHSRRSG